MNFAFVVILLHWIFNQKLCVLFFWWIFVLVFAIRFLYSCHSALRLLLPSLSISLSLSLSFFLHLFLAPAGMLHFLLLKVERQTLGQEKKTQHDASSDAIKLDGASSYRTGHPLSPLYIYPPLANCENYTLFAAFYGFILTELLGAQSPAVLNIRIRISIRIKFLQLKA